MKKLKFVSFMTLCVILLQIVMPILMDVEWNNVFAVDENTWDVSANGDGSVIATLSDDGTFTVSGNGEMKNYSYSSNREYNSKKDEIKKVVINEGVTSIGQYAFSGCTNLSSIEIPESVTSIGRSVFSGCTSLSSINVSTNNKEYLSYDGVLYTKDKTILKSYPSGKIEKTYTILDGVEYIAEKAFIGCTNLDSINIPNSVTCIGNYAFCECKNLDSINIPESVTGISNFAFSGCTSLSSINIPNNVTYIGERAFQGCTSLISINLPESVTRIGWHAFEGCTSLSSINIPNSVTDIGISAFEGCTSLSSIDIPESVMIINWSTFEGCTSLSSINIPDSVTSIGDSAFEGCASLSSINIPESVTSIGTNAFEGCASLSSINIPESVTSIERDTFRGCTSLSSIKIPSGVTSIGNCAFCDCTSLSDINIPESVTEISNFAFSGCTSISSINIPNGITSIGLGAFQGCTSLTIYCKTDSYAKEYAEKNNLKYVTDDVAPTIESITGNENWTKDQITLTVNATDALSGLATEAYSFDNGQTWQKENTKTYTENTQGVIVQVRDALGNIATYETININNILKIEIKDYEIVTKDNENYLTKINEETTIAQIKEKIQTNGTVKVLKGETEITDPNTYVGTGMIIQIESEKYIAVVRADLNGDGTIGLSDLANIKLGLIGKVDLSTAQKLAGDVNGNGKMALSDMANLKMYLLKKVNI